MNSKHDSYNNLNLSRRRIKLTKNNNMQRFPCGGYDKTVGHFCEEKLHSRRKKIRLHGTQTNLLHKCGGELITRVRNSRLSSPLINSQRIDIFKFDSYKWNDVMLICIIKFTNYWCFPYYIFILRFRIELKLFKST